MSAALLEVLVAADTGSVDCAAATRGADTASRLSNARTMPRFPRSIIVLLLGAAGGQRVDQ